MDNLRKVFGLNDCEDHEIIDAALEKIAEQERAGEEVYVLRKGRRIHRVTLTNTVPAKVVKVELNISLEQDVRLSGFNNLGDSNFESPGAWFVRCGFIVRSKMEDGFWVQYAFMSQGADNLTRSEAMEYLSFTKLAYDPSMVSEFGPVVVAGNL